MKKTPVDGVTTRASSTLQKAGQRLTRHRVAVMGALRTSDRPVTADEVAKISAVPLSTAYRNLAELCDAGVAVRVGGADRTDRFEIAESLTSHHHHH
ncbi:MAG: transcriptional repressor, partial [Ilumatobacteraceae bacterium]